MQPVAPTPHAHEPAYTEPAATGGWTGYAAIKYVAIVIIVLAVVIGLVYLLPRIF
ncbi:MAG TPA: hypothetical protein VHI54_09550 [Actinomycetota bacterium]|nr:hypothetical protein [Actinomycetota bacterium]